jgi:hypothetical protein
MRSVTTSFAVAVPLMVGLAVVTEDVAPPVISTV